MKDQIEMEKKFLIKSEETFADLLTLLGSFLNVPYSSGLVNSNHINNYTVGEFVRKKRQYRYFDTFERVLEKADLLAYVGPLEREGASASVRMREDDFVFTVKIPTENQEVREEYHREIPAEGVDFYDLSPEGFLHWQPMRRIKEHGGNRSLQEVVRLTVETHRYNLYSDSEMRVEIAVDKILGESPLGIASHYQELEIETMGEGTNRGKRLSSF